jgi:hypothetical protein
MIWISWFQGKLFPNENDPECASWISSSKITSLSTQAAALFHLWIYSQHFNLVFKRWFEGVIIILKRKLRTLMQSHLSILALITWAIRVLFGKLFAHAYIFECFPVLVSKFQVKIFDLFWIGFCTEWEKGIKF